MFAKEILEQISQEPSKLEYFNDILEIGLEILDK